MAKVLLDFVPDFGSVNHWSVEKGLRHLSFFMSSSLEFLILFRDVRKSLKKAFQENNLNKIQINQEFRFLHDFDQVSFSSSPFQIKTVFNVNVKTLKNDLFS